MGLYLGIDGGGSKTIAVIQDEDGRERGRGQGGPCNIAICDDQTLRNSIESAVESALTASGLPRDSSFAAVCTGVAGYSVEARRTALREILQALVPAQSYRVEPDYVIAYWGATHGSPGIIVIAGTGAVAYGRNANGDDCREDGLGYLLGDRGSGFNLGLRTLQHALDGIRDGDVDSLSRTVMDHIGAHTQSQIVQWLYGNFSTKRVAGIAPVVGAFADAGDAAACKLVSEMAMRLRHTVRIIRHRLWLDRNVPVYPIGGLWRIGRFFVEEFTEPNWRPEPGDGDIGRINVVSPQGDAAVGAALLAAAGDAAV
jgi:N-acetylglucosamine kinase